MELLPRNLVRKLIGFAAISILATLFCGFLIYGKILSEQENALWNLRAQYIADPAQADPRIKIIIVDQYSLDVLEKEYDFQWPVSRQFYEAILKFLEVGGAKAVAFDLIFSETQQLNYADDLAFAQAIDGSSFPVINTIVPSSSPKIVDIDKFAIFAERQKIQDKSGAMSARFLDGVFTPRFPSAMLPIRPLLEAKRGLFGSVREDPDDDGVYRYYSPGAYITEVPLLSLAFATYLAAFETTGKKFEVRNFMDNDGRLTLRFHGKQATYKTYSFIDVVRSYAALEENAGKKEGEEKVIPKIDPAVFKGSIVFIGVWAAGLQDLRPTPLDATFRGVEVHATALDNILHSDFIHKLGALQNLSIASLFIFLCVASCIFVPRVSVQILLLTLIALTFFSLGFLGADKGYWIAMFNPLLAMLLGVLMSLSYQYTMEGRQRKFIKDAFRYYVSPGVIDKIIEDPTKLSLGGEKRELTIFFSDIAGFTSISEKTEASKLVPLLNTFLSAMTDIIMASGGTVDKYVGDAIVAFWNAPIPLEDHAVLGVKAALECQKHLGQMQEMFMRDYGTEIRMRVGMNTGVVSVGNFGSRERFNYTMIGDAANLASRLEGANKYFGTNILITDSTRKALGDLIRCRRIADIKVVGKSEVITVFEPLQRESSLSLDQLTFFENALDHYNKGDLEKSIEEFKQILRDPVARVYATKIERDMAKIKAGTAWSPVWNLTDK